LIDVLRALVEIHGKNIVHRDLKPDNIIVARAANDEEHAQVLDFGIAKLTNSEDDPRLTQKGVLIGTPMFMSPEQIDGKAIDHRSDLYAVGCLIHHLATGAPPFASDTTATVLMKHLHEPRPPLPKRLPSGRAPSAALEKLYDALIAKNPARRPANAEVVLRVLERIARG
jgi:serine/threonine-protein kinase